MRVRGAHHARVRRENRSVHVAAPGGCPRTVPDRRRAGFQKNLRSRVLVALQRVPLEVRRPRGSARVLPVLDLVGFSDLRAGEGGVRDPGGGPGREAGRDEPRSIADGVRRDVARLGPRGGARRHAGEDRSRESRDIQASRSRVHVPAGFRGDGGVTETRGRARGRPTDGSAAAFVRQGRVLSALRGRHRARARRRAPEAKRRPRRAARSRVGVQGEARVGPRGGGRARRG